MYRSSNTYVHTPMYTFLCTKRLIHLCKQFVYAHLCVGIGSCILYRICIPCSYVSQFHIHRFINSYNPMKVVAEKQLAHLQGGPVLTNHFTVSEIESVHL